MLGAQGGKSRAGELGREEEGWRWREVVVEKQATSSVARRTLKDSQVFPSALPVITSVSSPSSESSLTSSVVRVQST